jgi:hypothetical protein
MLVLYSTIIYIYIYSPSNPHLQLIERLQGADFGTPQTLQEKEKYPTTQQNQVHLHIEKSRQYLEKRPVDKHLMPLCKNFHDMCTLWAIGGECEANPYCKYCSSG